MVWMLNMVNIPATNTKTLPLTFRFTEPTMAEIRLQLSENELDARNMLGSVAWLAEGLNIEKSQ